MGATILPFVPRDWRHEKALKEANRRDVVWARKHPSRLWRLRPIIPHEFSRNGCEGHNLALVHLNYSINDIERVPLFGRDGIPDDDRFLGPLWFYIQIHHRPGEQLDISPITHRMLLELSGHTSGVPA